MYSLQSGPKQLEFGHVFEDPNVWEQRYEKKDFDTQRYQGKVSLAFEPKKKKKKSYYKFTTIQQVKWGDKDGSYGEQYWDLNHGGAEKSAEDNVRLIFEFFFFAIRIMTRI